MSAAIQPLAVVQINLTGLYNGQRCINTFHYYASGSGTAPGYTVNQFLGWWYTNVWGLGTEPDQDKLGWLYHETVTDVTITGQITAGTGSRSVLELINPEPSTGYFAGGTALPSGASMVISRRGNMATRKAMGRLYTFGVPSTYNDSSNLSDGARDAISSMRSSLEMAKVEGTGGNTLTLTPCLVTGSAQPTSYQTGLIYGANTSIRYQRRREVGRGI